jgi:hypothetical protein
MQFWTILDQSQSGKMSSILFRLQNYFYLSSDAHGRGVSLLIHYSGTGYGEAWVAASWLQLAGLLVLLFGTAIYNGSLFTFDDEKPSNIDSMNSGMIARSVSLRVIYAGYPSNLFWL